jgi:hypothetical protein
VIAGAAADFSPCPCAEAIVGFSHRLNPRPFGFISRILPLAPHAPEPQPNTVVLYGGDTWVLI